MHTTKNIKRLNDRLRQELGTKYGKARYQWIWSEELTMPTSAGTREVQTRGGLYVVQEQFKLMPLVSGEPRWALAVLMDPGYSESAWSQAFGSQIPYPHRGYYFPTDMLARPGAEPDADVNAEVIAAAKRCLDGNPLEVRDQIMKRYEQAEQDKLDRIDNEIENLMSAPDPKLGVIYSIGGKN